MMRFSVSMDSKEPTASVAWPCLQLGYELVSSGLPFLKDRVRLVVEEPADLLAFGFITLRLPGATIAIAS